MPIPIVTMPRSAKFRTAVRRRPKQQQRSPVITSGTTSGAFMCALNRSSEKVSGSALIAKHQRTATTRPVRRSSARSFRLRSVDSSLSCRISWYLRETRPTAHHLRRVERDAIQGRGSGFTERSERGARRRRNRCFPAPLPLPRRGSDSELNTAIVNQITPPRHRYGRAITSRIFLRLVHSTWPSCRSMCHPAAPGSRTRDAGDSPASSLRDPGRRRGTVTSQERRTASDPGRRILHRRTSVVNLLSRIRQES